MNNTKPTPDQITAIRATVVDLEAMVTTLRECVGECQTCEVYRRVITVLAAQAYTPAERKETIDRLGLTTDVEDLKAQVSAHEDDNDLPF